MKVLVSKATSQPPAQDMACVSVVLPAYNEERRVAQVVRRALEIGAGRVVCVNDGSRDSTGAILDGLPADPRMEALHHPVNRGKQAAVKTGLRAALAHPDVSVIALVDADMQNDPAILPGLVPLIGPYDMVIGVRNRGDMPPQRRLANSLANLPYRLLAGIPISDVQSGCRLYRRPVAECLIQNLTDTGRYTLEHTTMLLFGKLACQWRRDFRIAEVEVAYTYEGAVSSIRVRDNMQLTWAAIYHALALARLRS
jgi:glycosyltransferase involved in cell wall biosynthesis